MNCIKYILLPGLLAAVALSVKGQTRIIEGLKRNVYSATSAERKLQAILSLCDQGYSLHPDTLMAYANSAEAIAEKIQDKSSEVTAMFHLSAALTNKGLLDSALHVAEAGEQIVQNSLTNPLLLANILNQKGRCYVRKNQYKEAIDMGYKVIGLAEKNKDVLLQVKAKTLIGWAYLEMGQSRKH
ncbi:MAG: hypothetical protein IPP72_13365 [Chitinophagaceae bacterium]|nr:hypothetical protein [Chitinophagaceae bacterium]